MENMAHMANTAMIPAANSPYPTSVMPASMNAPMQVSPAMYDNANMPFAKKAGVQAAAYHNPCSDMAMLLVLFILLVIILRGRC